MVVIILYYIVQMKITYIQTDKNKIKADFTICITI